MTPEDIARSLVLSTRSRIEIDPAYDRLAAALQRSIIYRQSLGCAQTAMTSRRFIAIALNII